MIGSRVAAAFLLALAAGAASAQTFDQPADTQTVTLPPDPANPQAKPKRTCTHYDGFVVKEVDLGEKGAAELSIAATSGEKPKCDTAISGEVGIDPEVWAGYFRGAKGGFVFFDADDGWNGGMAFAVFDTQGRKLFDDSKKGETFAAIELSGSDLVLRYRRVWQAPCSMMTDATPCWSEIAAATSLADSARPDCAAAYRKVMDAEPKFSSDVPAVPSVIAYDAEARYADGKLTIAPRSGSVECGLAD